MPKKRRSKKNPPRTISTRSFKPNTESLNKLTNLPELPHSTGVQSNMTANSSSATNNLFQENLLGYGQDKNCISMVLRTNLKVGRQG